MTNDELWSHDHETARLRDATRLAYVRAHPDLYRELTWLRYRREEAEYAMAADRAKWEPQYQLLTELIALLEARNA